MFLHHEEQDALVVRGHNEHTRWLRCWFWHAVSHGECTGGTQSSRAYMVGATKLELRSRSNKDIVSPFLTHRIFAILETPMPGTLITHPALLPSTLREPVSAV